MAQADHAKQLEAVGASASMIIVADDIKNTKRYRRDIGVKSHLVTNAVNK